MKPLRRVPYTYTVMYANYFLIKLGNNLVPQLKFLEREKYTRKKCKIIPLINLKIL